MQALPYDPSWIERRLLQDISHVVHRDRYDRVTIRLTNLYRELTSEYQMSAIDRIKAKALRARDIVPQAIKAFETDLDSIIAEGPTLDEKRIAAVAPHKEATQGLLTEIDGLKQAMDMLSNGGPPLSVSASDVAPLSSVLPAATVAQQPQAPSSPPPGFDIHTRRDRP